MNRKEKSANKMTEKKTGNRKKNTKVAKKWKMERKNKDIKDNAQIWYSKRNEAKK